MLAAQIRTDLPPKSVTVSKIEESRHPSNEAVEEFLSRRNRTVWFSFTIENCGQLPASDIIVDFDSDQFGEAFSEYERPPTPNDVSTLKIPSFKF